MVVKNFNNTLSNFFVQAIRKAKVKLRLNAFFMHKKIQYVMPSRITKLNVHSGCRYCL
jgi:hypothetical protein